MVGNVRDRTTEFLLKFGDRGAVVLNVALTCEPNQLGDFSYRCVQEKLAERGQSFDPKMLLRSLEKDFGITETSYKSANQHWWKFLDREQVEEALSSGEEEDPAISVVKVQAQSLDMEGVERKLSIMMKKVSFSEVDRRIFRQFSFEELPLFVKVYNDAVQYEETQEIAERIKKVINMAKSVAMRMNEKSNSKRFAQEERKRENNYVDGIRLPSGEDNL
ncbi:hypothetical protein [Sulfuracidifex tepidarius]|uniref:Uncharacterized protein n=1 Tax=Sulfuracidifex tepidarius TaxID=1294262 RepID=A0A510DYD4_9CREN|nr:hypothetical protein [Sulfuracidifex tepidarius]BBG25242.1 hypothetical protein IC006_2577 [Sulfuracidifex tepidarius]BBG28036.1 hypothetical protein IC007_2591 [Sulfuracidifex tepidarius]